MQVRSSSTSLALHPHFPSEALALLHIPQLNAFLKQAGAVPALSEMALTAPEAEVRQLASLELRKVSCSLYILC